MKNIITRLFVVLSVSVAACFFLPVLAYLKADQNTQSQVPVSLPGKPAEVISNFLSKDNSSFPLARYDKTSLAAKFSLFLPQPTSPDILWMRGGTSSSGFRPLYSPDGTRIITQENSGSSYSILMHWQATDGMLLRTMVIPGWFTMSHSVSYNHPT